MTFGLVDERWVSPDHDDSNERAVRSHLLQGAANSAEFVPLFGGGPDAGADAAAADKTFKTLPTFCLLYTSPSPRDATLSRMPSSA